MLIDRDHWNRILGIAEEYKKNNDSRPRYGPVIRAILSLGLPMLESELAAERAELRARVFLSQFRSGERAFANEVLTGAPLQNRDLSDRESPLSLRSADLNGANLAGANLSYADLDSATLEEADLRRASLREANLEGANLRDADLRYCDVCHALYDSMTKWPDGFDYRGAGAITALEKSDLEDGELSVEDGGGLIPSGMISDDDEPIQLPPPRKK